MVTNRSCHPQPLPAFMSCNIKQYKPSRACTQFWRGAVGAGDMGCLFARWGAAGPTVFLHPMSAALPSQPGSTQSSSTFPIYQKVFVLFFPLVSAH